ncbi:enoyl-CoA delta isomerase 1, mitochondrial-like [Helicoverpa zea]|uniref:enoyl-CoA delta isomerase 1, mitochondrial-like n=1 Tax=Helicoverpa zea TaxID=7113 RepID=UPI001F575ECF|nr:enoyl-CoA delta isomerase 1, mitochondrial-like [Helicoverpa zea]
MFHLRQIPRALVVNCRQVSSLQSNPLVGITVDDEGIATVQMQRVKVNSLNVELLQALRDSICEVEEKKCKGMVLTSVFPTVFSAGLDLNEFHKPDVKRLTLMNECIFHASEKLFGTDLITTIAINGYTGAGACILALVSEYRAMTTGQATIGLNDTAVGIIPGKWIYELMARVMSPRHAEHALTSSFMYPAERALEVGLIDAVATDKNDAIEKCKTFIRSYDNIPPEVRAATKRFIREDFLKYIEQTRKQNLAGLVEKITNPAFQVTVDQYLQNLKNRKAAKSAA